MALVTASVLVAAPPERVFAVCTDLDRFAERIPDILRVERLTPGPFGTGTRFRETRKMFGKEATEEMTVTAFEPPRRFVLGAFSCGNRYATTHTFEPEAGGTRLNVAFEGKPETLGAKLMSPLWWFMKGTMRKCLERDLGGIKSAAEATPA